MNRALALASRTTCATVGLTVALTAATATSAAANGTQNGDLVLTSSDKAGASGLYAEVDNDTKHGDLTAEVSVELGHAIGFRHEHTRPEAAVSLHIVRVFADDAEAQVSIASDHN